METTTSRCRWAWAAFWLSITLAAAAAVSQFVVSTDAGVALAELAGISLFTAAILGLLGDGVS